jgi:hypothetical protein
MGKVKKRKYTYVIQGKILQSKFPKGNLSFGHNGFSWTNTICPTPLSESYKIKLDYKQGRQPNIYVIDRLKLAVGKSVLPHVYDTSKQHLCLYHRKSKQWHSGMLIAKTIIPWTHEWLLFYEYWLIDGIWHGGGIGHEKKKPLVKSEI